ncbi:Mitochondrial outer membrane protein iml2 [Toensbergia leucococca]|nr:Mitochondrial outer membrane protein iml2 [Toensbergia leucococca]
MAHQAAQEERALGQSLVLSTSSGHSSDRVALVDSSDVSGPDHSTAEVQQRSDIAENQPSLLLGRRQSSQSTNHGDGKQIAAADPAITESTDLLEKNSHQFPERSPFSLYRKFGWLAMTILIVATALILGAIGFLWFLWKADHSNKTWHRIAVRNWITRAVALSSVVVRTSISMQASTATSMLAGLALENTQILLLHLASVSTMRNANAGPYMLAWLMLKAFIKDPSRWHRLLLPGLVVVLVITTFLTQFTSTTLLSDLNPGTIPGHNSTSTVATNFRYDANGSIPLIARGTVWTKKPPFYPTFAEYHEVPSAPQPDNSDTGLTLRAFLPLSGQDTRSMLRNFSGLATVLDSRVQCMRPQLSLEKAHYTPRVFALTGLISSKGRQGTNFSCVLPELDDSSVAEEWQLSMTYLEAFTNASSAPVQSEFQTPASSNQYGMTFVVVNLTAGNITEWTRVLGIDASEFGTFGSPGAAPLYQSNRREWLDLLFTKNASLVMSVSICYASYDTSILAIEASSNSNRTEPVATYNVQNQNYDYSNIRLQLGQSSPEHVNPSPNDRGVLSIKKRSSWKPGIVDYPNASWVQDAVTLKVDGDPVEYETASSTAANLTAYLYNAYNDPSVWPGEARIGADPSTTALFQESLKAQGSVAFAIQSILTIFTGMTYYDQLQQFNNVNEINTTSFILVSRPSAARGITAVTIVVSVHLLLVTTVIWRFISRSTLSTIGNAWQTIAQVRQAGSDAETLLHNAALATDGKIEKRVEEQRWIRRLAGLKLSEDHTTVELVHRDSPGGLTKMMKNARRQRHRLIRRRMNNHSKGVSEG